MTIITRFLNLFYLPTLHEEKPTYYKQPTRKQNPPELSQREKLEIQAKIIVKKMGSNPDTVKYMSDKLLQALIIDYINENRR